MIGFISDIHLNPEFPERTERFRAFVELMREIPEAREKLQIYILGDLFDFWYERNDKLFDYYKRELELLRDLAASVQDVGIIFGNRDFSYECYLPKHIGKNIRILGDEAVISHQGRRILLHHGDLLCRNDSGYLRFRRRIRSPWVKRLFGSLPWVLARLLIKKMMKSSVDYQSHLEQRELEIDGGAVDEMFKRGYDQMIFGHVHKQFSQTIAVDGRSCELVSPGSCMTRTEYALLDDEGLRFHP